jgi:CheY-like chemotaxis protein
MSVVQPYVLVADDDALVLRSLQFVLRAAGFRVVVVGDGAAALDQIHLEKPRVALLDVMMPRMNGLDVCRTIKSDDDLKDIRVFLVTARAMAQERDRGLQAGADDYITKPFSHRELAQKVREAYEAVAPSIPL